MAIKFACPYCDKVSSVPDSFAGKKGKCPACQKVIEVPDPNAGDEAEDEDEAPDERGSSGSSGSSGADTRDCPYCGEEIKKVAKKCKFCGEFLDKRLKKNRGRRGPKPDTHLGLAIASTLLCCWPVGIVAIINAAQVSSKYNAGDIAGARNASENAKKYATISFVLGLIVGVLQIAAIAAGG
jgi:hypothetical protein